MSESNSEQSRGRKPERPGRPPNEGKAKLSKSPPAPPSSVVGLITNDPGRAELIL